MTKNINLYKLIIAGYLHDIGKLLWRGGQDRGKKYKYKVAHAQQVLEFFENNDYGEFWKEIGLIASLHHAIDYDNYNNRKDSEQKELARIIYMADNISATERVSTDKIRHDEKNTEETEFKESVKNIGLTSVFENIMKVNNQLSHKYYYDPTSLDEIEFNFKPKKREVDDNSFDNLMKKNILTTDIQKGFKNLKDGFTKDFKNLLEKDTISQDSSEEDFRKFVGKLDILFQNYFSFVPSDAYTSIGDVSLYDHTKIIVGLSVVMYQSSYQKLDFLYSSTNPSTNEFMENDVGLIAGDFPSIQKYIFDGIKTDRFISKRLRARSLRVQLINEAIIQYLLDKLNLSRANVLMNAGGKFVILTKKNILVDKMGEEINSLLFSKFKGTVKLNLISDNVSMQRLFTPGQGLKNYFVELFDKLNQSKFKIYTKNNISSEDGNGILSTENVSGKMLCKYCGNNYVEGNRDNENNDSIICNVCSDEKELGENIVNKNKEGISINYIDDGGKFNYEENGTQLNILFNNWDINKYKDSEYEKCLFILSKSLNNYVPKDKNSVKSFDKIIKDDKSKLGIKEKQGRDYLCMLKGDVDNMGMLFKRGFDYDFDPEEANQKNIKSIYSISRLVQFSRYMELFFGSILAKFLEKELPNVYTVFSGGDDFVFIVPFSDKKDFIKTISILFNNFVADNNKIHFSLGLSIFRDKTPFRHIDVNTELLLKSAKQSYKNSMNNVEDLTKRGFSMYDINYTTIFDNVNNNRFVSISKKNVDQIDFSSLGGTLIYKIYENLLIITSVP